MAGRTLIVAVLGTGAMGQGIAQVTASAGHPTRMHDALPGAAKRALDDIAGKLEKLAGKGKITDDARVTTMRNLSVAASAKDAALGADLVIEAVPEDMAIKVALFQEIALAASPHAILATNTSSLSITELGRKIGAEDRTVGLHFFNPPPVMELLEVVRGLATSEETIAASLAFAAAIGKTPILVRDVPGFATSRLGVILGAEAMRMLESGVASAADIDRGMKLGYRHPMGPLELTDLVGLDVRLAILEHLTREIGDQFRPPVILRQMVRAGRLGRKTGQGFYRWIDGVAQEIPRP